MSRFSTTGSNDPAKSRGSIALLTLALLTSAFGCSSDGPPAEQSGAIKPSAPSHAALDALTRARGVKIAPIRHSPALAATPGFVEPERVALPRSSLARLRPEGEWLRPVFGSEPEASRRTALWMS